MPNACPSEDSCLSAADNKSKKPVYASLDAFKGLKKGSDIDVTSFLAQCRQVGRSNPPNGSSKPSVSRQQQLSELAVASVLTAQPLLPTSAADSQAWSMLDLEPNAVIFPSSVPKVQANVTDALLEASPAGWKNVDSSQKKPPASAKSNGAGLGVEGNKFLSMVTDHSKDTMLEEAKQFLTLAFQRAPSTSTAPQHQSADAEAAMCTPDQSQSSTSIADDDWSLSDAEIGWLDTFGDLGDEAELFDLSATVSL